MRNGTENICSGDNPLNFEGALEKYNKLIYRIAYTYLENRSDAEDILQESFLKLYQSGITFENEDKLKAWLIRVASNASKSALRSLRRRKTEPIDGIEPAAEQKQDYGEVYEAVLKLKPAYKEVVLLFYYNDMPVSRIAETLGIREGAVKTRLSRARERLKELLKGDYDYE